MSTLSVGAHAERTRIVGDGPRSLRRSNGMERHGVPLLGTES